jgi:outer membrane receptor protein involved in Fe transport
LPNALVSDPPLEQVVSRTLEFGVRGNPDGRVRWNAGYFHAINYDDLLFIASPQTGFGYFTNFGKTRREGVESAVSAHFHSMDAGAEYTFLDATYQSPQTIESGSNSSNSNALGGEPGVTDGGLINIVPGDHIPQVPQHMLKLYSDYHPLRKLEVSADFNLISSSYVRGNENNLEKPDGQYYLGMGKSPGFGIVNLGTRYSFSSRYEIFAEIDNVLNRHYYTAGQLSDTPYDNNGNFIARAFPAYPSGDYPILNTTYLAPGAPIGIFGGLKVTVGKR